MKAQTTNALKFLTHIILAIGGVDCLDLTWLMMCDLYVFTRLFHRSINVSKKSRENEAQCIRINRSHCTEC